MRPDTMVLVRKARADWLRAQCEVAYVRVLMMAQRYAETLRREDKYSPDQPRVPAGNPDGGQWTDGGGTDGGYQNVQVAQSGPARPYVRSSILVRFPEATPEQEVRWAVSDVWARDAIRQAQGITPGYRTQPSFASTIEGEIARNEADARDAERAIAEAEAGSLTGFSPRSRSTPKSLADVCAPGGNAIGSRAKGAGPDVRTVTNEEFDRLLLDLTQKAKEIPPRPNYNGLWYQRTDGTIIGVRRSHDYGLTIDIVNSLQNSLLRNNVRIHEK